jgi:hypothetical protein
MLKICERPLQGISFNIAMKFILLLFIFLSPIGVFAQDKVVQGIIFDKLSKDRIAEVNVKNATSGKSIYNNLKGIYTLDANVGDVLIFTKQNYRPDTLIIKDYTSQAVYMQPLGKMLKEVTIHDTIKTPEQQYEATKRDYTKIYGPSANPDWLSVGPGGVGLGIDALYNSLSRSGRNAEHLRGIIQQDYYQNVIDYRFNKSLVARVTGLKDGRLTDFMQKYRPGYYFVSTATEYEFITYIKSNLKRYLRRPKVYTLPELKE